MLQDRTDYLLLTQLSPQLVIRVGFWQNTGILATCAEMHVLRGIIYAQENRKKPNRKCLAMDTQAIQCSRA